MRIPERVLTRAELGPELVRYLAAARRAAAARRRAGVPLDQLDRDLRRELAAAAAALAARVALELDGIDPADVL